MSSFEKLLLSKFTCARLLQISESAMSPVRSPARIPSPESLTPPPSATDVERKIKDAVGLECYPVFNVVDNDSIKIIIVGEKRVITFFDHLCSVSLSRRSDQMIYRIPYMFGIFQVLFMLLNDNQSTQLYCLLDCLFVF